MATRTRSARTISPSVVIGDAVVEIESTDAPTDEAVAALEASLAEAATVDSVTLGEGENSVTVTVGKTYRRGGLTPTARIGRAHLKVTRDADGAIVLTYTNRRDETIGVSQRDFLKLYNAGMRLPV